MKFSSASHEERLATLRAAQAAREEWHPWFAWYPKRLSQGGTYWLETIERRFLYAYGWDRQIDVWEYRAKGSVL